LTLGFENFLHAGVAEVHARELADCRATDKWRTGLVHLARQETWPALGLFYRRVSVFMGNYAREIAQQSLAF